MTRYSEAFKALEETQVRLPPSYPPPADERAETHRYLPAVPEFFGQRCCHPANAQLPHTSQHAATLAYEALERTLDIGPPSGVRTVTSPVSADTQAVHAPDSLEGEIDMGMGGRAVLGGAR